MGVNSLNLVELLKRGELSNKDMAKHFKIDLECFEEFLKENEDILAKSQEKFTRKGLNTLYDNFIDLDKKSKDKKENEEKNKDKKENSQKSDDKNTEKKEEEKGSDVKDEDLDDSKDKIINEDQEDDEDSAVVKKEVDAESKIAELEEKVDNDAKDAEKDEEENCYIVKVRNTPGYELPNTGGSGTLPYTLGGLMLIISSALMYGFRMRRRERRLN